MDLPLARYVEALIFVSKYPVDIKGIKKAIEAAYDTQIDREAVQKAVNYLVDKYDDEQYAFELVEIAEGFQFMTKGAFYPIVESYLKQSNPKRLSRAALETLSIIAYKQPVVKSEVEHIRGVNCDYTIQKLLDKELIEITGREESPGKPLIYATSEKFMNYFGLKSIKDLPQLKEFKEKEEEIGYLDEIEESIKEEE